MHLNLRIIFSVFFTLRMTHADFECEESTNQVQSCEKTLTCRFDDEYKEKAGYTRYCRCKTAITDLPLPNNRLEKDLFFTICSQHESRLQELSVTDAELESIDNAIFAKYKNLKHVNLAGNQMNLNFTEQAGRLTVLDLSNNGINFLRPATFANLKSLKSLNLGFNRLDKTNFCFEKLTELEEIYLNNNQLTSIGENEFDHISKLRILDLSHNLLTFFDRRFCLYNLKELLLNNNKLSDLKNLDCKNLTNLESLNLARNELRAIEANTFTTINRIKDLDISSNDIKDIHPDVFHQIKDVKFLNLDNNSLTEEVINCDNLQHLGQVNTLYLSHNQISQIYNCTFSKLENLSKLSLLANQLENIPPSTFSNLKKLQELNLAENQLSEIPDELLDNLKNLKSLNVSHNKLTTFNLNSLNAKLTELDLKYNNIKDLDLNLLKNKLPALKTLDLDPNLIKCGQHGDVLQYFEENSVVVRSCTTPTDCCRTDSNWKLITIVAVSAILGVFAIIGLFAIICMLAKPSASGGIHLMPIVQSAK